MVKNYKGGYKIIALAGISLVAGATITIAGIHKSIEASYQKPLLIEGIVIDGVEKNAVWVKELKVVDGSFVIELYGLKLTITDEDEVTVEEIHVPTKKQVTLNVADYDLELEDGDEIIFIPMISSDDGGTIINFPNGTIQLLGTIDESLYGSYELNYPDAYITIYGDGTYQVCVKRIGDFIFITSSLSA